MLHSWLRTSQMIDGGADAVVSTNAAFTVANALLADTSAVFAHMHAAVVCAKRPVPYLPNPDCQRATDSRSRRRVRQKRRWGFVPPGRRIPTIQSVGRGGERIKRNQVRGQYGSHAGRGVDPSPQRARAARRRTRPASGSLRADASRRIEQGRRCAPAFFWHGSNDALTL